MEIKTSSNATQKENSTNTFGVMLDCSRNAVISLTSVKRYIDILSAMGYNSLMLYTEETYEIDKHPLFGYQRGRYSKDELTQINDYASAHGIELIPCIQTLAHLNSMFKWQEYKDINDCADILLIDEEKTYELIEDMFTTLSQCFTSRRVHIGMDEAYNVGLGQYLQKHGVCDRFELINRHLHRVCEIAAKHGFEAMIWSDMFCKLALDSGDYYSGGDTNKIREKANLPENVSLVYWDYYSDSYEHYDKMLKVNAAFGKHVVFAGGAWAWKGFAPDNAFSIKTTKPALEACRANGVNDIFITVWADDGAECSKFAILPSLMYAAELKRGNDDLDSIKKKFNELFDTDFDTFLLLDELNDVGGDHDYNPCNYLLYNDCFCGLNDYRTTTRDGQYYKDLLKKFEQANILSKEEETMKNCKENHIESRKENSTGEFGTFDYVLRTGKALCDALTLKADLGVKTRALYRAGDKAGLQKLINEAYAPLPAKLQTLHDCMKTMWFTDSKPYGFEIQDIRLGGLIMRVNDCASRLQEFIDGKTTSIPELEEELIASKPAGVWGRFTTANVLTAWT